MRKSDLINARREAAHRKRRIILDDDGDLVFSDDARRGPKPFLHQRFMPVLGRPVDSVAWCIMWAIAVALPLIQALLAGVLAVSRAEPEGGSAE